jgi:hypothetical protein
MALNSVSWVIKVILNILKIWFGFQKRFLHLKPYLD